MADSEPRAEVVVVATYPRVEAAQQDYDALVATKRSQGISRALAVVVTRQESGKVKAKQHSFTSSDVAGMGAVVGIVAGAVLAAAFPPLGLAVAAAALAGGVGGGLVGGAVGAAVGHLEGDLPARDITELGAALEVGAAALVVACAPVDVDALIACVTHAQSQHVFALSGASMSEAISAVRDFLASESGDSDASAFDV